MQSYAIRALSSRRQGSRTDMHSAAVPDTTLAAIAGPVAGAGAPDHSWTLLGPHYTGALITALHVCADTFTVDQGSSNT